MIHSSATPHNLTGYYAIHNKHDPHFTEDPYNYCYEILGSANDASHDNQVVVLYKPLYTQVPGRIFTHREDHVCSVRLLEDFFGTIQVEKNTMQRFLVFPDRKSMEHYRASLL